jgi:hypothetical protein
MALTEAERDYLGKRLNQWSALFAFDELRMGVGDCPTGFDAVVRARFPRARVFEADWASRGLAAGPERNQRLVDWAAEIPSSYLIAAPHIEAHRGTKNTICYALVAGLRINVYPMGVPGL